MILLFAAAVSLVVTCWMCFREVATTEVAAKVIKRELRTYTTGYAGEFGDGYTGHWSQYEDRLILKSRHGAEWEVTKGTFEAVREGDTIRLRQWFDRWRLDWLCSPRSRIIRRITSTVDE
ncbi:MAG TPA: hypothetical protein VNT75_08190 [Symbiobacteriaceae bacterium]|nr:hypothetical protein [Symbiobacteriaceae bacterium]